MARGFAGVVPDQLRTLFEGGAVGGLSDGELLGRFLDRGEGLAEAAFEALVCRHGPLVYGVCRRALRDVHLSEDAFQATFLILARKARSIRNRDAVGAWLVGVAGKVAARAKGDALRRQAREDRAAGRSHAWSEAEPGARDEVAALLEEVDGLKRPLRDAVILCHLQGLTYDSAAKALGITEGAVRGRLARAREVLRSRLGRRGYARDASGWGLIARPWPDLLPTRLVESTVRGAMALDAGRAALGGVSGPALTLMEGALQAMWTANVKTTGLFVLGVGLITLGAAASVLGWQKPEPPAAVPSKPPEAGSEAKELADLVDGRIAWSVEVTKDCMILAYLPEWNFGNVDNIGVGSNDGGNRTLVDWPDVPAPEAQAADRRFYLALYSRATNAGPKPSSLLAFALEDDWSGKVRAAEGPWPERTSWRTRPHCGEEPVGTYRFEPGEGWKLFDVTDFVRSSGGKSSQGLMLRFLHEDRRDGEWSGYQFVSREGAGNWAGKHPRLLVVERPKR